MGAASSVHLVNTAIYDIHVDVYKLKDTEGTVAVKHYVLLPGETKEIKIGKAANIRISGNGRTEGVRAVSAGDVLEIDRIRRPKTASKFEETPPARPSALVVADSRADSRSVSSDGEDVTNHQDWVDFKTRNDKDELQQLTRKLEREQLQKRQAEYMERRRQQEEAETDDERQSLEIWKVHRAYA